MIGVTSSSKISILARDLIFEVSPSCGVPRDGAMLVFVPPSVDRVMRGAREAGKSLLLFMRRRRVRRRRRRRSCAGSLARSRSADVTHSCPPPSPSRSLSPHHRRLRVTLTTLPQSFRQRIKSAVNVDVSELYYVHLVTFCKTSKIAIWQHRVRFSCFVAELGS